MMNVYTSVDQLIGNTPLLELTRLEAVLGLQARLFAKAEQFNPGGSAKDRVAKKMLDEAERLGKLRPGAAIIEPTSGNTGIGLCAVGASRGYRVIIVMPDSMSVERRLLMKAYGAEVVLTPGKDGMSGAIAEAERLAETIPGSFVPGQFDNPDNPRAHYETTGPELWRDLDGKIDFFVAGVGTGGTVSGVGKFLKEKNPRVRVVGVEPAGSAVLSGKPAGKHGLQGIGAGFVPAVLAKDVLDEVMTVTEEQAYETARLVGKTEGILIGISGGAALYAAAELAKSPQNAGKQIAVLLPDSGERYLSTPLFE